MLILTTEQMKRAETLTNKVGLTYLEMMLNAGLRAYEYINAQFEMAGKSCVILCGNGNNAGDGFVVANKLSLIGCDVTIVFCNGEVKSKTAIEAQTLMNLTTMRKLYLNRDNQEILSQICAATVIVDAIFGTGFQGEIAAEVANLINYANDASGIKIALDIPSGINADSGECAQNHFCADVTLAFATLKPVHTIEDSKKFCGRVIVCDIGIPNDIAFIVKNDISLITAKVCTSIIPKRNQHTHKGNYGRLVNISGSADMCGAAIMSTTAGMRVGAGLTTLVSTRFVTGICAPQIIEATTYSLSANEIGGISDDEMTHLDNPLGKATACLVGCGMGDTRSTRRIVEYVINNTDCSLVLDADALNVIATDLTILNGIMVPTVITPHIGEMARLSALTVEQVQKNTMETARVFAHEHNVTVVLKANRTIIATPDGEIFQNTTGNAGLAKGGSGDVLAGMIAGLLAQGLSAKDASICGVFLHGLAGDDLAEQMSQYSILARDLLDQIPITLKSLDR